MEDIFVAAGCARRANSAVLPIIHWMLTLAMAILLLAPVSSHADPASRPLQANHSWSWRRRTPP